MVELAGVTNSFPTIPSAAPRNLSDQTPSQTPAASFASSDRLPLYFVENRGQVDNHHVSHYVQGRDRTIYFAPDGLTFALLGESSPITGVQGLDPDANAHASSRRDERPPPSRWVVKLDFLDSSGRVQPTGRERTPAVVSYFKGPAEQRFADLPTFAELVYSDLWPGIDLVYSGTVQRLKYRFVVAPGADPGRIRWAYRGADVQLTRNGQLDVATPFGGFQDARPVAYQDVEGERVEVKADFVLPDEAGGGRQAVGFELGAYDSSQPLVIDPSLVVYAGYIGGDGIDGASDVAVDPEGNAYVTGFTSSSHMSFPVAAGPDTTFNADQDVFVAKVNAAGTALIYAGYIGGSGSETGNGIAVDADGNAYVTGSTESTASSFPVTVGPDLTFNGGATDAFVAKVNAAGTALVYAGYIGGSAPDAASGIDVDAEGNAYVAGDTLSPADSFPLLTGPDLTFNGGRDAFVSKVNPAGTALVYSGYLGGAGFDIGRAIALDSDGNAYVVGETGSNEETFLATVGPDLTFNGGARDAFIAKVGSSGAALEYAGYIGGAGLDFGRGVAVDAAGRAYVTGDTGSGEGSFPVAVGPDLTFNGGARDAFIASVTSDGTALAYAGYIGGAGVDQANAVAVDSTGSAHVAGFTGSTEETFPVGRGPDLTFNGALDAFVARVHSSGTSLIHASYVGGEGDDLGWGIALDGDGFIYIAGETLSAEDSFPVTVGPDVTFNGLSDAFVAKLDISVPSISADGIVNAASFLPGPIAPGEIISIFGSRIGPDEGVGTQLDESGRVATELAGTQVLFDGEPVPLFFVREDQVNAQATYRLDGLTSTEVQIIYQGEASNVVTVPVAPSAPGFFALPEDRNQVIAILPDGSLNSAANPAQPGDTIVMYATGEGQTVPAGEDGKLAEAPFPEPVLPVEVVIGGLPAKLLYFGAAPGFAGLVQINAEIPEGLQTASLTPEGVAIGGNAVPVTAGVGDQNTQDDATIAIGGPTGGFTPNVLPVANGLSVMTDEDTPLSISLSGSHPDGDLLTFSIVRQPANGSLGSLTQMPPSSAVVAYTPGPNFSGPDSLKFKVTDPFGEMATATVNITVKPVDDPPIANDDTITTVKNKSATRNVRANDSDPDGDPLTITAVTQGSNGSVTTNGQTVTYTPNKGFTGSDSFTYTISDDNSTDTATVNVRVRQEPPMADLSIDKALTSGEFKAGQQATYTLTVTNSGTEDATNATVNDTIPAPLTLVSATPSQGNPCAGDPAVTCNLGTIPAGQSATVTIVVNIPSSATGVVSNTASVTSPDDQVPGNNSDTEMTTIQSNVDLSISKTDGLTTVVAGTQLTYTITAANAGPHDPNGAMISDTIPIELVSLSLVSCTPLGGATCDPGMPLSGNHFNATVNIPAGGSVQYLISGTVDPSASGTISNTASVTPPAGATETNPGNESATDNDTVITKEGDLSITKTDNPDPITDAAMLTYTITVANSGPSDAVGVVVTDTFPAEFETPSWTCVANGAASSCTSPGNTNLSETVNIAAAGSVVYTVNGTINAGASTSLSNTAALAVPAGFNDTDGPGNNMAMQTTTIAPRADLNLTKVLGTPLFMGNLLAGKTVIYDLKVTNNGPNDATGVTVVDTFPTLLSHNMNTCMAVPGAGIVTWTVGPLANGAMANCSITFDIDPTAAAAITNSAIASATTMLINTADDNPMLMNGMAPATLSVSSGSPQQTPINTAFTNPLVALLQTADSMPIAGVMVTFTPPAAGASAVITGSPATTSAGGLASVTATANLTVGGPYNVVASVSGAGGTLMTNFSLENLMNPPVAMADSYQTAGNTLLEVASATAFPNTAKVLVNDNLCANDTDPSMLGKTVSQVQATADGSDLDGMANGVIVVATMNGGTVAVTTSTCEFNYKPPADSGAVANSAATTSDSFTYMLTFGVGTATVSIGFVNQIWFVDNTGPGSDIGTSTDPFDTLAEASTAAGVNDTIFVYTGDGTDTGQNTGILLDSNNLRLIGQGVALTIPDAVTQQGVGVPGPQTLLAAGTAPKLGHTTAASNDIDVISSGADLSGIEIMGLTLTGSQHGINVAASGTDDVEVSIANVTVGDSGDRPDQHGLNASNVGTGDLRLAIDNFTVADAGMNGVNIVEGGTGRTFVTSFENNSFAGDAGATGVQLSGVVMTGVTFDSDPNDGQNDFDTVNAGGTAIGASVTPVGAAGMVLTSVAGDVHFGMSSGNLDIFATTTGLMASGTGTFVMSPGSVFRITVPNGSTINSSSGVAVDLDPLTAMFGTSGGSQVTLSGKSASFNQVGGMLFFSSTSALTGGGGDVFTMTNSSADITYGGTIVDNTGTGVTLGTNGAGGSASFTGTVDLGVGTALTNAALEMTGNNASFTATFADLDIVTSGATGIFGTTNGMLDIDAGTVMTTGAPAVDITGIGFGTTVDLTSVTVVNPGSSTVGIDLNGVSGNFNVSGTTTIGGTGAGNVGTGILIQNSSAAVTFADVDIGVGAGPATVANGVSLSSNTGSATFSTLDITNTGGTGLFASSAGTVNVTTGGTINATSGRGIDAGSTAFSATFTGVSAAGADRGIVLSTVIGTLNAGMGSLTPTNTGTSIGLDIDAGTVAFTYAGSINGGSSNRTVEITNMTAGGATLSGALIDENGIGISVANNSGGTFTFSGASVDVDTATNTGVSLSSNTGATINFTNGGLTIDTTTATGFSATGGGTVNVSGAGNTVATTTATAVNITDTTIGTGVTFQSINTTTSSANTAIILDDTGSGPFSVTGTGSDCGVGGGLTCNGGTIDNKTTDAVTLNNTGGLVTLENMLIEDIGNTGSVLPGHDAIHGQNVNGGLKLDNTTIRRITDMAVNGGTFASSATTTFIGLDIVDSLIEDTNRYSSALTTGDTSGSEAQVRMRGISGTVNVTGSVLQRGAELLDFITASTGTLTMTVQGSEFLDTFIKNGSGVGSGDGLNCIDIDVDGSTNATINIGDPAETTAALGNKVQDCTLRGLEITHNAPTATGTITAIVSQNTFENTFHTGELTFGDDPNTAIAFAPGGSSAGGAAMNVIFSHNTTNELFGGGAGISGAFVIRPIGTAAVTAGPSQFRVNNNTFNRPLNTFFQIIAERNSTAKVLFDNNTLAGGLVQQGPGFLGLESIFEGPIVDVRTNGNLQLTVQNMTFPDPIGGFGFTTLEDFDVETENAGANLCFHVQDTVSGGANDNAFLLKETAGTFNLAQDASTSFVPLTVLADNINTVTSGVHVVVGGVGVVAGTCLQPTGGVF